MGAEKPALLEVDGWPIVRAGANTHTARSHMLLYNWLQEAVDNKGGSRALIYRDTYLSWRGLMHRVDRRAAELKAAGIDAGDWVGLMLGNVPDFVILSLALSKLEAAPIPLDPTTSTRELDLVMGSAPLRGLVTRPRGGDAPLPSVNALRRPIAGQTGLVLESRKRLQGTLLSCSIFARPDGAPAIPDLRIGAVLITADSNGEAKPVERTAANLLAEAENLVRALGMTSEDKVLITLPLFHSYGFDLGLLAALKVGAAIYLEDEVSAARIIKLVREQQITLLPGTRTLFEDMAKLPASRTLSHKPIRFISVGGGLSAGMLDMFRKKYGFRPIACYHSTETGTVSLEQDSAATENVGQVLEGVEVRILSEKTGAKVASGRKGQLWVRSQVISPLTAAHGGTVESQAPPVGGRDPDGWYRTGYLAMLDRGRRLHLVGREDKLVVLEGKRVALGEVEGCLEAYPDVESARAQLITDPLGGPMVVARVVVKNPTEVNPESIIDHCARNLSPYKVPRRIELCETI